MGMCGSSGNPAKEARNLEHWRQYYIKTGKEAVNQNFQGFDDEFYRKREEDYIKFAIPQLNRQLQHTNREATYSLANRGLLHSGSADRMGENLAYETNQARQNIADEAIRGSQSLRKQVEGERSALIAQLQASADPTSAAQAALASASQFSAPSPFAQVGPLFQNFSNLYLAKQANKEYSPYLNRGTTTSNPLGSSAYSIRK